jgi:hypothetical protein
VQQPLYPAILRMCSEHLDAAVRPPSNLPAHKLHWPVMPRLTSAARRLSCHQQTRSNQHDWRPVAVAKSHTRDCATRRSSPQQSHLRLKYGYMHLLPQRIRKMLAPLADLLRCDQCNSHHWWHHIYTTGTFRFCRFCVAVRCGH